MVIKLNMKVYILEGRIYGDIPFDDYGCLGVFTKRQLAEELKEWLEEYDEGEWVYKIREIEIDKMFVDIPMWWLKKRGYLVEKDK